jgi:hypothetical protein
LYIFLLIFTRDNYRLIHGIFHIAIVISKRPWYRLRGTISVEGWWQGQYEKSHVLIYLSHILPGQITCYCPSQELILANVYIKHIIVLSGLMVMSNKNISQIYIFHFRKNKTKICRKALQTVLYFCVWPMLYAHLFYQQSQPSFRFNVTLTTQQMVWIRFTISLKLESGQNIQPFCCFVIFRVGSLLTKLSCAFLQIFVLFFLNIFVWNSKGTQNGCVVMVRQCFSPTVRWSDSSIVRRFDSPENLIVLPFII